MKKVLNKWNILGIGLLSLFIIIGCSKEEEADGFLEPIAVKLPSTNPSTSKLGNAIAYEIECTTDKKIDSVMVYVQVDSAAEGYNEDADTLLVNKVVYPNIDEQSTIVNIEGEYTPPTNLMVGSKLYIRFMFQAKEKSANKRIVINMI